MAPLTWREVSAPNFNGIADTRRTAALLMNSGFEAIGGALKDIQSQRTDNETSAVLADALRYTDPNAFQEALRSGTILNGRNPANISPAAFDFLAGRTRDLQGNVGADLGNERSQLGNLQSGFNLLKDQTSWNRSQQEQAVFDAGKKLFGDVFAAGAGTPASVERAIRSSGAPAEVQAAALAQAQQNNSTLFGPPAANSFEAMLSAAAGGGDFVTNTVNAESSGDPNAQNSLSSAGGLGGFTDGTWLETIKKHRPDIKGTDQELLALKNDRTLGPEMVAAYAQDNTKVLERAGIPVTNTNLYLAHFAGPGGVQSIFKASDNTPLDQVLGKKEMAANPFLAGKDVAWLKNYAAQKQGETVNPSTAISQAAGSPAAITAGQGLTDEIVVDQSLRQNLPVLNSLVTREYANMSVGEIANQLISKFPNDGSLTPEVLTRDINQIMERTGVAPDVAASLLENSLEGYTTRFEGGFGKNGIFTTNAVQFGADLARLAVPSLFDADARRVDYNRVDTLFKELIDPDTKQPTQKAVSQIQGVRIQEQAKQQIAQVQTALAQAQQEYQNAVIRASTTGNNRILVEAQRQWEIAQDLASKAIAQINSTQAARVNSLKITKDDEKKK